MWEMEIRNCFQVIFQVRHADLLKRMRFFCQALISLQMKVRESNAVFEGQ